MHVGAIVCINDCKIKRFHLQVKLIKKNIKSFSRSFYNAFYKIVRSDWGFYEIKRSGRLIRKLEERGI